MPDWVWIQNVVFPILGMGMGTLFMIGVYRVVTRWIDRRHERELSAAGGDSRQDVERLMARLHDTEVRVEELEERLDFAERLLAQRDPGRLGSGA